MLEDDTSEDDKRSAFAALEAFASNVLLNSQPPEGVYILLFCVCIIMYLRYNIYVR